MISSRLGELRRRSIQVVKLKFPETKAPHIAYIKDRARNSGLTSVRWVDDNRLVVADFNEHMLYLVTIQRGVLEILDQHKTVLASGQDVETDLMDYRDGLVVVSNFYQGSESYYSIIGNSIRFLHETNSNTYTNLHGVRFIPGTTDLLWKTYCGNKNKVAEIYNFHENRLIHSIPKDEQLQDVAFLGDWAVMAGRTDHISRGTGKANYKMYATLYLLDISMDLHTSSPKQLDEWRGEGHLDALKEFNGKVYAANQYTNTVDVFSILNRRILLRERIEGFGMPHGLDIREDGLMAVTNYEDQTLRLHKLEVR